LDIEDNTFGMVLSPGSIRTRTHTRISKIILYYKYKSLQFSGLRLFLSAYYAT